MEKDKLALLEIISRIEGELQNLKELRSQLDSIKDKRGVIYKRSKGSILHDFYNCCERIFKEIAIELNQGYAESEKWHKILLYRMTIPIRRYPLKESDPGSYQRNLQQIWMNIWLLDIFFEASTDLS